MNRSKRIYKSIMLIIIVALVTFILTSVFLYNKIGSSYYLSGKTVDSQLLRKIYALKGIIDSEYITEVNEDDLINGAIKGYVEGLGDEYSEYFTKEEMDEFKMETEGSYVGIGVYMAKNTKDNNIIILAPIENSPAEKAGLLPGDIIKKIDDVAYTGEDFEKVSAYIKGKEGTTVKLEIERDGKEITFNIERKNIELYPIKSEVLENNIGYINIDSFDENTKEKFKDVYTELNKKNIKGLIIDLRNNGGGIVDDALEIADYALEKNKVMLVTKDKTQKEEIEKSKSKPIITQPIVLLVNENTASSSEILVAALKENNRATVVGETTYGKGVIQELITLSDGSGVKITIEEYYTPNKNKINGVGIKPDIEVHLPDGVDSIYNIERKDDTQLQEAIKVLSEK